MDLPPHGKLAFSYARSAEMQGVSIVLEDMAMYTGLNASVCGEWVDIFVNAGMLERATVLDPVL